VLTFFGAFMLFFDPGLDHVNGAIYKSVKLGGLMGALGAGAVLLVLGLNAVRPVLTHRLVDACLRLVRVAIGGLELGDLPKGSVRALTESELKDLRRKVGTGKAIRD